MSSVYSLAKISPNVSCIREHDPWNANPLMYLLNGSAQNVLVDTGCGSGDLRSFVIGHLGKSGRLTVINTHNHAEQTGANWRFSTTGRHGQAPEVNDLCASSADPYYTKSQDTTFAWQVKVYKVTKWLEHEEVVRLDSEGEDGELLVLHTPGHTPDSIALWFNGDQRLFIGDLFYQCAPVLCTYERSDLKLLEQSTRMLLGFIKSRPKPNAVRLSSSKVNADLHWNPALINFHRFILGILAGTAVGRLLPISDHREGSIYENRDKTIKVILSRKIVAALDCAQTQI